MKMNYVQLHTSYVVLDRTESKIIQTLAQIWENWTSNPYEPRIIYQNRTYEPSKNPKPMNWIRPNMLQHYLLYIHFYI